MLLTAAEGATTCRPHTKRRGVLSMKTLVLATAVAAAFVSTPARAQNPGSTTTSTQTTATQTTQTTTSTWVPSTGTTNQPTYEFSLGYQWLRTGQFCAAFDSSDCSDDDPETFPAGVMIDAVRNFGAFGIVGEAGWSRAEETGGTPFADRLETDLFHAGAGVR